VLVLNGSTECNWGDRRDRTLMQRNASIINVDRAEATQRDAIPQLLGMGLTVEQVAQALSLSVADVERVD
jgi:predicted transposase YdaD